MPLITRRSSTRRAPGWFFGICGAIAAQASSLSQKSVLNIASLVLENERNLICYT